MIDGIGRGALPRLPAPGGETGVRAAASEPAAAKVAGRPANASATIVRDMAASAPVDSARVAVLRTAIAGGSYKPDPDAIAARMLAFGRT
ncbi:MAG: flagellar biosynthesis anti-sigma factor FlgM [Sandarakinorhabdus sp.]|nr:flagellar biosynthesis anti-sigma factor FlgM [Sandarakinorhabdus sp.]